MNKSFPCTRTASCPGCSSDNERTRNNPRRYGTFVYLVDQKRVLPFKVPQRLSERLTLRAERNDGTLRNRDYVIIRSGAGLDTDYDVDQDERYALDIEELWKTRGDMEIADIVSHSFEEAFGDPNQFADDAPKPSKPASAVKVEEEKAPWESSGRDEFKKGSDVEVTEDQLKSMSRNELKTVWIQAGLPEGDLDDDWGKTELVKELLARAS
jgi:hypothetical protein